MREATNELRSGETYFLNRHIVALIDDLEKVQKRADRFVTRNYTYEKGCMGDILKN